MIFPPVTYSPFIYIGTLKILFIYLSICLAYFFLFSFSHHSVPMYQCEKVTALSGL